MQARRGHEPVLLEPVLRLLAPAAGQTYVDATAGCGGHAAAIAARLGPGGVVVLNDADATMLAEAERAVRAACGTAPPRLVTVHGNFAALPHALRSLGLAADLLLVDLGFASAQVDDPSRGFSFRSDGPLDMRFDPTTGPTAAALLASLSPRELERMIADYGEERAARAIARKIVAAREVQPITTTAQLASLVRSAVGPRARRGSIDAATRTFQALRIATNDELGSLAALLAAIRSAAMGQDSAEAGWLRPEARVAFVAFHSLEDRPVKHLMRDLVDAGLAQWIERRAVKADDAERARNPRSRSARLRAIRLTGAARSASGRPARTGADHPRSTWP